MLDSPWGDVFPLLPDKQGALNPVADESPDPDKRLIIDKDYPDLVAFPTDTDGVFIEIDIFDVHVAKFGYPDTRRVDRSYDQFVSWILNRIDQAEYLVVLKVLYLLLLDPGRSIPLRGFATTAPWAERTGKRS